VNGKIPVNLISNKLWIGKGKKAQLTYERRGGGKKENPQGDIWKGGRLVCASGFGTTRRNSGAHDLVKVKNFQGKKSTLEKRENSPQRGKYYRLPFLKAPEKRNKRKSVPIKAHRKKDGDVQNQYA